MVLIRRSLAEREGFEPSRRSSRLRELQSRAFVHSATSPWKGVHATSEWMFSQRQGFLAVYDEIFRVNKHAPEPIQSGSIAPNC